MRSISNIGSEKTLETAVGGGLRVTLFIYTTPITALIFEAALAAGLCDSHVGSFQAEAALS